MIIFCATLLLLTLSENNYTKYFAQKMYVMKRIISVLLVAVISILIFSFDKNNNNNQAINALAGDASFVEKFHSLPDKNTDEDLRIKTHLEYAEKLLRKKNISHLSDKVKQKRFKTLDLLHAYWTTGIFPRNYDYAESRKPCFIDKDNRICAVGYLVEKTAGRKAAEQINLKHKYDEILAMNDNAVDSWIANSGLTKEECALIQPSYGPAPVYTYNHISSSYGISSSVLGGVNLSLSALNTVQMVRPSNCKTIPVVSLVTGAGQVVLGAVSYSKNTTTLFGDATNQSKKTLSMVNIGLGTTTMILSAWNLISRKKAKEKSTSWNLYSIPAEKSKMNIGVSFAKRF